VIWNFNKTYLTWIPDWWEVILFHAIQHSTNRKNGSITKTKTFSSTNIPIAIMMKMMIIEEWIKNHIVFIYYKLIDSLIFFSPFGLFGSIPKYVCSPLHLTFNEHLIFFHTKTKYKKFWFDANEFIKNDIQRIKKNTFGVTWSLDTSCDSWSIRNENFRLGQTHASQEMGTIVDEDEEVNLF
jgi:hypothetical protein